MTAFFDVVGGSNQLDDHTAYVWSVNIIFAPVNSNLAPSKLE